MKQKDGIAVGVQRIGDIEERTETTVSDSLMAPIPSSRETERREDKK